MTKKKIEKNESFLENLKNKNAQFYNKYKKTINFLLIIFLVAFFITIAFNLTYNLHFYKNPKISIEPTQSYKKLENNQNENILFEVNSKTNFLCKSSCEYEFIDRSSSTQVQSGIIKNNIPFNVSISGPNIGSGVIVYNLDVTCKNKKSIFCPYDSLNETTKKSSFVVLAYDLSESEKNAKEDIRPKLLLLLKNVNLEIQKTNELNLITSNKEFIFFNKNKLDKEIKLLNDNLNNISKNTQKYYSLWEEQKFLSIPENKIDEELKKVEIYSMKINEKTNEINLNINLTTDLILRYNLNINKYNNLTQSKNKTIILTSLPKEIKQSLINLDENNLELEIYLINISSTNYEDFELKLNDFENNLYIFENQIEVFEEENLKLQEKLLQEQEEIRCFIGYCPTYNPNFCENIENLKTNTSYLKYELKDEIYLYNNTYYNKNNIIENCLSSESSNCILNQTIYIKEINSSQTENITLSKINIINLNKSIYQIKNNKIEILENTNLENISKKLCTYVQNTSLKNYSTVKYSNIKPLYNSSSKETFNTELVEHLPICCQDAICSSCCTDQSCKNDEKTFPLLLVHGHSFLRNSPADPISDMFNKIEFQLVQDGYIDGGTLEFENNQNYTKDWSYLNLPIVLKTNYYYENYYDVGSYVYIVKKDESIDNYAIRLSENIEKVKKITGRPKVNIVAHSMGGLVVRRYIQIFGEGSVNKIILIGTPNHGVEGRVEYLCSVVGEKLECEDMKKNSILISKLNDPSYKPQNIQIYTISGSGCETSGNDGDGIVTLNSSQISYANKSYIVNGTCPDILKTQLHSKMLDIDTYPQVYKYIIDALNK